MPDLPPSWRVTPLGGVLRRVRDSHVVQKSLQYHLLGVRWYGEGSRLHDVCPGHRLKTKILNRVRSGQVTYNQMWVRKGAFAIVDTAHDGLYATNEYPTFAVRDRELDKPFFAYVMQTTDFQAKASALCKGTTSRARLNPKDFTAIEVALPPLCEQQKIAAILASVDAAMEANKAVIEQTRRVKAGLLQQLLTRGIGHTRFKHTELGEIPESWEIQTLAQVARLKPGGTPHRANPAYWGGAIPWIKTGQINFATIDRADEYITESGLENSAATIFPAGTIVMAMYGQGSTRGRVGVLGLPAATNQACVAFLDLRVCPAFLYQFLAGHYEQLRRLGQEGTQKNLSVQLLHRVKLPRPPRDEQVRIAKYLDDFDQLIRDATHSVAQLTRTKSGLLHDLLSGKVRVPRPPHQTP